MNIEETLKHLGNHWDLYSLAGEGEYSFDKAKKYLMEECGKPESTARAKMSAFRYAGDSLIKISTDGKRYSIDSEKVNLLEALVDEVIHFSDSDYRCDQMKGGGRTLSQSVGGDRRLDGALLRLKDAK